MLELGQLIALPTLADVARGLQALQRPASLDGDSWLSIRPGWPVVDNEGETIGLVQRVHGDRDTGAFECVDVASSVTSAMISVPAASVSAIAAGEIRLSCSRADLPKTR